MSAVLAVLSLSLHAQRARLLPRLLLLAAPLGGCAAAFSANGEANEGVRGLADALLLLLPGMALASAALGSATLRGERGEDSLRALLLAPIPRWKILLGLMLGAHATAAVMSLMACGSAALCMWGLRGFGDIAPGGMFITTHEIINQQAWRLAPLCVGVVPVAVLAGVLGATIVDDALVAFMIAVVVLLLPLLMLPETGAPFAPYPIADHALMVLRDLGEGRTEQEATVDCGAYVLRHAAVVGVWGLGLMALGIAAFAQPRRA